MEYSWRLLSCPKCYQPYIWYFEKFLFFIPGKSGLGPSEVQCSKCGEVFNTELREWKNMNASQKCLYIFLSIFYSLILGFTFSLAALSIIDYVNQISDPLFPSNKLLLLCTVLFSLLIIGIDIIRIELSNHRFETPLQEPMKVSFWTWQTNPQIYGIIITIINFLIFFLYVFVFR